MFFEYKSEIVDQKRWIPYPFTAPILTSEEFDVSQKIEEFIADIYKDEPISECHCYHEIVFKLSRNRILAFVARTIWESLKIEPVDIFCPLMPPDDSKPKDVVLTS